jgi:ankyrin repeat protein
MCRYIIKKYPDLLHSVDNNGWNAALYVARGGSIQILQLMKDKQVDVKHKTNDGENILHMACAHSHLEMARYIIQNHSDLLHSVHDKGWNAALYAAEGGNVHILQLLTENKVDVSPRSKSSKNILFVACQKANLEMTRHIIETYPELLQHVDKYGWNAAQYAAAGGSLEILELLKNNRVDVKHKTNNGENILHTACAHSHLEMTRYIIKTYPDLLHSVHSKGWNAALYAAEGGNVKILQLLAENTVDVNRRSDSGKNILFVACQNANLEMTRYIVKTYPDLLQTVSKDGWNAAYFAVKGNDKEILRLLADHGVKT